MNGLELENDMVCFTFTKEDRRQALCCAVQERRDPEGRRGFTCPKIKKGQRLSSASVFDGRMAWVRLCLPATWGEGS
jgi:hypothetical protein